MDFRKGDIVIDIHDRVGYISDVCDCMKCKERGFSECYIRWIDDPDEYDFVSVKEFTNGFKRFKRIGEYEFTKKKNNKVKQVEEIKIIKPTDVTLSVDDSVQDYCDTHGNILRKCLEEHRIIISGKTLSEDEFVIEIAVNSQEVGIKYTLPESEITLFESIYGIVK